ncbi:glycosyltransferase [Novosphingobium colocasiae]
MTALDGRDGVHVWGKVPDVRPWLAAADIALVPLEIARGVQNKVLEAMAMRLPVVLTTGAATGIEARDQHDYAIADSDDQLVEAVVALAGDPGRAHAMGGRPRGPGSSAMPAGKRRSRPWPGGLAWRRGIMPMQLDARILSGRLIDWQAVPAPWRAALLRLGAAWLVLIVLFGGDWLAMLRQWWDISTYNHILLIPAIIGWLALQRRRELAQIAPQTWWPGLLLLGGAAFLWLLGALSGLDLARQAGAVAMLGACVPLLLGVRATWGGCCFPFAIWRY